MNRALSTSSIFIGAYVIAFYSVVIVCNNLASWPQYTNKLTYLLTPSSHYGEREL